ncbi:MAG: hypothetical protein ACRDDY_08130 [Clostridium sp.]|uniref:hypothetical protein n=1 Tax=Clostridium sp. TaxID=1506 RepID=UPI003EE50E41
MLIKIKSYSYTDGAISIAITKNDGSGLGFQASDKPAITAFKLQKIGQTDLTDITITSVEFQSGSQPTNFDGLFKILFSKTNVAEGDVLVLGGTDTTPIAPFERIYNTVTVDGGLGKILETDTTTITMIAPNHNHTNAKNYNLVINNLTDNGEDSATIVVPLEANIVVNGTQVASVKLTKVTSGNTFNKGDKINFTVTFHSDVAGTSPALNFDGDVTDYLAIGFDYKS